MNLPVDESCGRWRAKGYFLGRPALTEVIFAAHLTLAAQDGRTR